MTDRSTTVDCRGLGTRLSVVRIRQIAATTRDGERMRVLLDATTAQQEVLDAVGRLSERIRCVGGDEPEGAPWWSRPDLRHRDGRLVLGGTDLETLARSVGTPAYVLRANRVRDNVTRLSRAMCTAGLDHRIHFAIKANRSAALLAFLRSHDVCGVDVCSAGELRHALSCGFPPDRISFTGTSLTPAELRQVAAVDGVAVNLDSVSALDSYGRLRPGAAVGIRVNPAVGLAYRDDGRMDYGSGPATKFGIYAEQWDEALAVAHRHELRITRVHLHVGCGYLDAQLPGLRAALDTVAALTDRLPHLREVNVGGGLGVPHRADDVALDLDRWATTIAEAFRGRQLRIAVEPGDFLVKDAGVLLTTVTYAEMRRQTFFVGLDAGFNLAMEPAFYGLPCEPVAVVPRTDEPSRTVTLVGNVNEALDVWATDHHTTPLLEGDHVALLNAGGYAASMRSEHCLRGDVADVLLID